MVLESVSDIGKGGSENREASREDGRIKKFSRIYR